jgi:hypothetical protein
VVDPGRYRMNASLAAPTRGSWTLKSILVGGVDVADVPFEIKPGQAVTGVTVTFTTRQASLSGRLLTADEAPAAGYYVVVFARDEGMWVTGSRRMPPPARAATDGRFAFAALPAGAYYMAALTSVDEALLADPAFLSSLRAGASAVTLGEGEAKVQDLKFARPRSTPGVVFSNR